MWNHSSSFVSIFTSLNDLCGTFLSALCYSNKLIVTNVCLFVCSLCRRSSGPSTSATRRPTLTLCCHHSAHRLGAFPKLPDTHQVLIGFYARMRDVQFVYDFELITFSFRLVQSSILSACPYVRPSALAQLAQLAGYSCSNLGKAGILMY